MIKLLKAIGGVRVKKSMLGSFERSPLGGTEAFYRMSKLICVQKLSHFEVCDFSRISYKKTDKIDILRYFTSNVSQFCPFFCKRSYQSRELQNAITFERKLILTFRKKPLSPLMEIFQINPTWIF